ncbi:MAG: TIGR03790 family protein [Aquabacterium sp.]|nr:TIGR03790 family protein [Aquabacterium sp.]
MAACSLSALALAQPNSPPEKEAAANGGPASQAASAGNGGASAASAAAAPVRKWISPVPRVFGRLGPKDLGLIINEDDPYSVQVGAYYAKARRIPADQILRVSLPLKPSLSPQEFEAFSKKVDAFYGSRVQGLALAWKQPFSVDCNSITGARALGYDGRLCSKTCDKSRPSSYFGSISTKPYRDHHIRLGMLLAAKDVEGAKALIDRGVRSDGTLGLRGAPPVDVHFVTTSDSVRSVRQMFFPPAGPEPKVGLNVFLDQTDALRNVDRVLIYMTGKATVDGLDTVGFVPGALADHLTSFGGKLDDPHGQMSVLSWIEAGATASYGTTSEPCAHVQKFPNPQALLLFYIQGATALEAYWKSVMWPQQGLFVGEPLAAPYGR